MSSGAVWWVTAAPGTAPVGPYDLEGVKGLLAGRHIQLTTPMWREGLSSWEPLQEVEDLKGLVASAPADAAASGTDRDRKDLPEDDILAAFKAEVRAIEGEEAPEPGPSVVDAPATPDELEFEDDDGTWYVWDAQLRKYVVKPGTAGPGPEGQYDADVMAFPGADDEVVPTLAAVRAAEEAAAAEAKKNIKPYQGKRKAERKAEEGEGAEGGEEGAADGAEPAAGVETARRLRGKKGPSPQPQQPAQWFELKNNTSVYVENLPEDATVEEVHTLFSKYGLIKEDEQLRPRIKLYRDKATGRLKGDGLVTYLKEPSVHLAVQLLDGAPFRDTLGVPMKVSQAKFEMKGEAYQPKKAPKLNKKEKMALAMRQAKALAWDGHDDRLPFEKITVVIKGMFSPDEMMDTPSLAEELEADVTAECAKMGAVDKVRVYKTHPEGVVTVRFKAEEPSQKCLEVMNGRWFGGRQLVAHMWDGLTNYNVKVRESAEEQEERLAAFTRELEAKRAAKAAAAAAAGEGPEADGAPAADGDTHMAQA